MLEKTDNLEIPPSSVFLVCHTQAQVHHYPQKWCWLKSLGKFYGKFCGAHNLVYTEVSLRANSSWWILRLANQWWEWLTIILDINKGLLHNNYTNPQNKPLLTPMRAVFTSLVYILGNQAIHGTVLTIHVCKSELIV